MNTYKNMPELTVVLTKCEYEPPKYMSDKLQNAYRKKIE